MKRLSIYRPVFTAHERKHQTAASYVRGMMQHLQDMEDWQRTMHEADDEGWVVCQMWSMEHEDGRVARLQDPWAAMKAEMIARGEISKYNLI